jgi:hypothetical protein
VRARAAALGPCGQVPLAHLRAGAGEAKEPRSKTMAGRRRCSRTRHRWRASRVCSPETRPWPNRNPAPSPGQAALEHRSPTLPAPATRGCHGLHTRARPLALAISRGRDSPIPSGFSARAQLPATVLPGWLATPAGS